MQSIVVNLDVHSGVESTASSHTIGGPTSLGISMLLSDVGGN